MRTPWRLAVIVPTIMVLVAALHAVRVVRFDQSTWQGAGFGMFATYDFDGTRTVVAVASVRGGEVLVPLDHVDRRLIRRVLVAPDDATLETIAEAARDAVPAGADRLVVEVRGPVLDGDTVTFRTVNSVEVDL